MTPDAPGGAAATQELRRTYVALAEDGLSVVGFVTVSAGQVATADMPAGLKLPRYPVPVMRIGRLAVDSRHQGRGIGKELLRFAFDLAQEWSAHVGIYGVAVEAKQGTARDFYFRLGFLAGRDDLLDMILPLGDVGAGGSDPIRRLEVRFEARRAARPAITYDEALPVNVRRAEIAAAIQKHQVVVICGETGSGKTTQLPKICLELGRGVQGLIGHTQPRRIAARATATRIAQELKSELGRYVGYKIRFTDKTASDTYIKLMTDGILLAETQTDPLLRQYDTILIDEAHERSLNIDFLLGYLKSVLPRRRDLKLIVTSATLDAERFTKHFDGAPIIEVSGRLYPIETRYRPSTRRRTAI